MSWGASRRRSARRGARRNERSRRRRLPTSSTTTSWRREAVRRRRRRTVSVGMTDAAATVELRARHARDLLPKDDERRRRQRVMLSHRRSRINEFRDPETAGLITWVKMPKGATTRRGCRPTDVARSLIFFPSRQPTIYHLRRTSRQSRTFAYAAAKKSAGHRPSDPLQTRLRPRRGSCPT